MEKRTLTEDELAAIRADNRSGDRRLNRYDNDEADADAVGDSEDEAADEDLASDTWHEGEV